MSRFTAASTIVATLVPASVPRATPYPRRLGAVPFVQINHARISRELLRGATTDQYRTQGALELARFKKMDAYIALRGSANIFEASATWKAPA